MPKLHVALIIRGNKLQLFTQICQFALIRGRIKLEELQYWAYMFCFRKI